MQQQQRGRIIHTLFPPTSTPQSSLLLPLPHLQVDIIARDALDAAAPQLQQAVALHLLASLVSAGTSASAASSAKSGMMPNGTSGTLMLTGSPAPPALAAAAAAAAAGHGAAGGGGLVAALYAANVPQALLQGLAGVPQVGGVPNRGGGGNEGVGGAGAGMEHGRRLCGLATGALGHGTRTHWLTCMTPAPHPTPSPSLLLPPAVGAGRGGAHFTPRRVCAGGAGGGLAERLGCRQGIVLCVLCSDLSPAAPHTQRRQRKGLLLASRASCRHLSYH